MELQHDKPIKAEKDKSKSKFLVTRCWIEKEGGRG